MAKKKQKKPVKKGNKKNVQANAFSGVLDELKHVTWPTRAEATQLTVTVLIISLIVALFVGIIDLSLVRVLDILSR